MKRTIFTLSLLVVISITYAQTWVTYSTYAGKNVKGICQDNDGDLWVATYGAGLYKIGTDGTQKNTFTGGSTGWIVSDYLYFAFKDKSGMVWVGNDWGGVSKYNGTSWTQVNPTSPASNTTNWTGFCAFQDKADNLLFGSTRGAVLHIAAVGGTQSFIVPSAGDASLSNDILAINQYAAGDNLWISTTGGVARFNGTTFVSKAMDSGVTGMAVRGDKLWVSFPNWFPYVKDDAVPANDFTHDAAGLSKKGSTMFRDSKNNMWYGTYESGVSMYDGTTWTTYNMANTPSLASNNINTVFEDNTGKIWIGTDAGLSKFTYNNTATSTINTVEPVVSIYPSFFTDKLTISSEKPVNYIISDISGKIVSQSTTAQTLYNLNTSEIAKGMYVVRTMSEGKERQMKLVKQ